MKLKIVEINGKWYIQYYETHSYWFARFTEKASAVQVVDTLLAAWMNNWPEENRDVQANFCGLCDVIPSTILP